MKVKKEYVGYLINDSVMKCNGSKIENASNNGS
jgi:hypothetical protein